MRRFSLSVALCLLMLVVSPQVAAQGAELRLLEPMQGGTIRGNSIAVIFEVAGCSIVPSSVSLEEAASRPEVNRPDEGHLLLSLDLQPPVVWDRDVPFRFENVLPGEHLITVELVNNDHSSLTPPVVVQHRVQVLALEMPMEGPQRSGLPDTGLSLFLGGFRARLVLIDVAIWLLAIGLVLRRCCGTRQRQ
jgi:hypothetical protein